MICDTILCSKFSLLQRYLFAFKKAIKIKLAVGKIRREQIQQITFTRHRHLLLQEMLLILIGMFFLFAKQSLKLEVTNFPPWSMIDIEYFCNYSENT